MTSNFIDFCHTVKLPSLLNGPVAAEILSFVSQRTIGRYVLNDHKFKFHSTHRDDVKCLRLQLVNLQLDPAAINEKLTTSPVELVHGFIKQIRVDWLKSGLLLTEIEGVKTTWQPKFPIAEDEDMFAASMISSIVTSVSNSTSQIAEDFITENTSYAQMLGNNQSAFAGYLQDLLRKIQFKFIDVTCQLEHFPEGSDVGIGLFAVMTELHYKDVDAKEDQSDKTSTVDPDEKDDKDEKKYYEQTHTLKKVTIEQLTLSTVELVADVRTGWSQDQDEPDDEFKKCKKEEEDDENPEDGERGEEPQNTDPYTSSNQRHIVPFAQFTTPIQMTIKIKRIDHLEGPKVSSELNMGNLVVFLTPRQLHLLTLLASELLLKPDNGGSSKKSGGDHFVGKPMTSADYDLMHQDMQYQLHPMTNRLRSMGLNDARGWSGPNMEDSDFGEHFVPMESNREMCDSMSVMSSMSASSITSAASAYTQRTTQTQRRYERVESDPDVDVVRLELHLATLTAVVLNEDLLVASKADGGTLLVSSVNQLVTQSTRFFEKTSQFFSFPRDRDYFLDFGTTYLDLLLNSSHLRLLAAPIELEGDKRTATRDMSVVGYVEVNRLVFTEHTNFKIETKKIKRKKDAESTEVQQNTFEVTQLLKFDHPEADQASKDGFASAESDVKLTVRHIERKSDSRVFSKRSGPKTDISLTLHNCNVELDITMLDRITALLNPPVICNVKEDNSWRDEDSKPRVDIRIESPSICTKIRFPKPDFRPAHDKQRTPYFRRNVRPDFLQLTLSHVLFQTSLDTEGYVVQCNNVDVSYFENVSANGEHIASTAISERDSMDKKCRLTIKTLQRDAKVSDTSSEASSSDYQTRDWNYSSTYILPPVYEDKGPFSQKRHVHESNRAHHKSQNQDNELKMPGEKDEIRRFISSTTRTSSLQLEIYLPTLSMQLLSKHTYELIYNRINNDLLMWQPSAPKVDLPKFATEGVRDAATPVAHQDVFSMCKSGVAYNDDGEASSDDESNIFVSAYDMTKSTRTTTSKAARAADDDDDSKTSNLTLNFHVGRGQLRLYPPARDSASNVIPNRNGEFFIDIVDANLFLVSGYKGDPNLSYLSVEVVNSQFQHCDMIETLITAPPLRPVTRQRDSHLKQTLCRSHEDILPTKKSWGGQREMITVAMKIQKSKDKTNVKKITIAAGFNKITLVHRMVQSPNNWYNQLIDFFNVPDYSIPGYVNSEIITEMYVYFWDSAVDYRPRYLPLRSVLTFGSFTISSHLSSTEGPVAVVVLRFIAEDCRLFLSDKGPPNDGVPFSGPAVLERDYVNVIEMGLFEISLKMRDKASKQCHTDLVASNNKIHIRTCSDSFKALCELIVYFTGSGDLNSPESLTNSGSSTYSSPRHQAEHELIAVELKDKTQLSESSKKRVDDLLSDALVEDYYGKNPSATLERGTEASSRSTEPTSGSTGTKFYFPGEQPPSKTTCWPDGGKPLPQVITELGGGLRMEYLDEDLDSFIVIEDEPDIPKSGALPELAPDLDTQMTKKTFLAVPGQKTDALGAPVYFPPPIDRYVLSDMTLVWSIYGGNDFGPVPSVAERRRNVNFSEGGISFSNSQPDRVSFSPASTPQSRPPRDWMVRGGVNRNRDVHMQFHLYKIRLVYEVFPETADIASRQVVTVKEVEILDKLKSNEINKFMYLYSGESVPKQSNSNMIMVKTVMMRDPKTNKQECCLKVSLQPLRFNIDQDALTFLVTFFTEISGSSCDEGATECGAAGGGGSRQTTPIHQPIMIVDDEVVEVCERQDPKVVDDLLLLDDDGKSSEDTKSNSDASMTFTSFDDGPTFIKKFVFAPAVKIKFDYTGKGISASKGINGLLMGIMQLNNSEVTLKGINFDRGILGYNNVVAAAVEAWHQDIMKNQKNGIIKGLGPLNVIVNFLLGFRDLVWMPIEQYKKDGRIMRGLHRGANSFTVSTACAALDLTYKVIYIIQFTAETAYDMLTPGPSVRIHAKKRGQKKLQKRPRDIREGLQNACALVKEGIGETAENLVQVAASEHETKGYCGVVGGVIRQLPSTVIKPIILASQASNIVLGGVRCQLNPDHKREVTEKFRIVDDVPDGN